MSDHKQNTGKTAGARKKATPTGDKEKKERGAAAEAEGTRDNSSPREAATSAVELLEENHRRIEDLFEAYEGTSLRVRKEALVKQICTELVIHTLLEEEIFYPACRQQLDDALLDEAQVELDGAKTLINELIGAPATDPFYDAKVKVLAGMIRHHFGEEEGADGIFSRAREADIDLNEIAQRLTARRTELMNRFGQDEPERPRPRSFNFQSERNMPQRNRERDNSGRFAREDYRETRGRYGDEDHDRQGRQSRDREGRYMSDRDDDHGYRQSSRREDREYDQERDDRGRFMSRGDDDDYGHQGRQPRDREGRYMSDRHDDSGRYGRGRRDDDHAYRQSSRGEDRGYAQDRDDRDRFRSRSDEDDYEAYDRRSRTYDYDDDGRGNGRGWYGDSEGHAQAARRGWDSRGDDGDGWYQGRGSSRGNGNGSRDHDEDDRSGRGRSQSGWYGDPEGHSRASRRGWQNR